MQTIAIERVHKGQYFRHKGQEIVYVAKGFEPGNKKWRGVRAENGHTIFLSKGTFVEIDFDF